MHKHEADISIRLAVITISTSKWKKYGDIELENLDEIDDESGRYIVKELSSVYDVVEYRLIPDDIIKIQSEVTESLKKVDAVVTTGGTGITPTDLTVEAIEPVLTKKMDGFGEVYRLLSYNEVGGSAILSRAFAGIIDDKAVFCLPGSVKAVKLAVELIKDLLRHAVSHAKGLR
jgi:molybdenum cofactor biosynthesis protein B